MKNLLVVGLCAVFATSAFASELGIQFDPADPNTVNGQNATVVGGDAVTVQVLWTQDNSTPSGLSAAILSFTALPEDPAPGLQGDRVEDAFLFVEEATPLGWDPIFSTPGNIGGVGQQVVVGGNSAAGTTVIGTFKIRVASGTPLGLRTFYILRTASDPLVVAGNGSSLYTYNASPAPFSDTYSIGSGFAGIDVMRSDDAIPLVINVVPEPATFTLLAMGGFAVLRRRSVTR